jgi:hypothetical protein
MKIHAIYCNHCKNTIYSRARHDMRSCTCKTVAVDGGFDYSKISFKEDGDFQRITIEVDTTKDQLFEDWNTNVNKFGLIKENKQ